MSRLDDALAKHGVYDGKQSLYFQPEVDDFKDTLKALMLELIGEDETFAKDLTGAPRQVSDSIIETRNWFRAELRQKVNEL